MRPIPPLILAAVLAGCSAIPAPQPAPVSLQERAKQPVEPLGGFKFTTLAAENMRYAGGTGVPMSAGASGSMTAPAMSVPAPAPTSIMGGYSPATPKGLTSGNMNGGYYGYGPSYGNGTPTALLSITQAEAPGSRGPYLQLQKAVIEPVLADWAPDAQLLNLNGSLGPDGLLVEPSTPPSGNPACGNYYGGQESTWQLTFLSTSRNEMLNFMVTPAKTTIVRTRWAPLDLRAVTVSVDADVAIRALTTAITTKDFQGEEEKTGQDYFMGQPFANMNCAYPVPLPSYGAEPPQQEVLYEVPAEVRWNANLQVMLGKPVWQLNFYAMGDKARAQEEGFYTNMSANGMVDAGNGAVIRFSRPNRMSVPKPMMIQSPVPVAVTPMPQPPSPIPSPQPSATASPL